MFIDDSVFVSFARFSHTHQNTLTLKWQSIHMCAIDSTKTNFLCHWFLIEECCFSQIYKKKGSKMKLITYNFLTSKCIRGVKVGYPLKLNVSQNFVRENHTKHRNVFNCSTTQTWIIFRLDYPQGDGHSRLQSRFYYKNDTTTGLGNSLCWSWTGK